MDPASGAGSQGHLGVPPPPSPGMTAPSSGTPTLAGSARGSKSKGTRSPCDGVLDGMMVDFEDSQGAGPAMVVAKSGKSGQSSSAAPPGSYTCAKCKKVLPLSESIPKGT
eukprot:6986893-Pyramimonas_sp.AAC.1